MKVFKAVDVCRLGPGAKVALTPDQAKTRMHNLKALGDDVYEAIAPIEFKRDEEFGYEGALTRALEAVTAPADDAPKVASAQKARKAR